MLRQQGDSQCARAVEKETGKVTNECCSLLNLVLQ
jgi:hypothetical protein